jgi:hypothetical protein
MQGDGFAARQESLDYPAWRYGHGMTEEISIAALLQCAKRELVYRKRVYPRLVGEDKMSPQRMAYEIACMTRIVEILDEMNGRLL